MCTSTLKLMFLSGLLVVIYAQETTRKPTAEIITESTYIRENGYNFEFKTSDGISRKEEAELITVGDHQGIGVRGSYSYTAPNGQEYLVTFTADDKGYKPEIRTVSNGNE